MPQTIDLDKQIAKMLLDGDSYTTIENLLNVSNHHVNRINNKVRAETGARLSKRIPNEQMKELKQQAYRYFDRHVKPIDVARLLHIDTRIAYAIYDDYEKGVDV